MIGLVALLGAAWRETKKVHNTANLSRGSAALFSAVCLAFIGALAGAAGSNAETVPAPERVRGFFCNEKTDSINFLVNQAMGENEEMAANAVNKSIAKFSCAYYLPVEAIYTGEHTIMRDGLVFKLHSYLFLPEKVERWSGSVLGSLQQSPNAKHDV
jgi:hypothetical protein